MPIERRPLLMRVSFNPDAAACCAVMPKSLLESYFSQHKPSINRVMIRYGCGVDGGGLFEAQIAIEDKI